MASSRKNAPKLNRPPTIDRGPASRAGDAARPRPIMPSQRAVAEAAYFLWQRRGGDQLTNWLEAEAKLKQSTKN